LSLPSRWRDDDPVTKLAANAGPGGADGYGWAMVDAGRALAVLVSEEGRSRFRFVERKTSSTPIFTTGPDPDASWANDRFRRFRDKVRRFMARERLRTIERLVTASRGEAFRLRVLQSSNLRGGKQLAGATAISSARCLFRSSSLT